MWHVENLRSWSSSGWTVWLWICSQLHHSCHSKGRNVKWASKWSSQSTVSGHRLHQGHHLQWLGLTRVSPCLVMVPAVSVDALSVWPNPRAWSLVCCPLYRTGFKLLVIIRLGSCAMNPQAITRAFLKRRSRDSSIPRVGVVNVSTHLVATSGFENVTLVSDSCGKVQHSFYCCLQLQVE